MMQINRRSDRPGREILIGTILGGLLSSASSLIISLPAYAEEVFGNQGIQFEVDTIVEFEFVGSHGAYQSTFGVVDLDTKEKTPLVVEAKSSDSPQDVTKPSNFQKTNGEGSDFDGSPGETVPSPLTEFEFKANKRYAFYLESTYNDRPAGIVYSTDAQNPTGTQRAQFEGDLSSLANGGSLIRWDDTGSVLVKPQAQDTDFDDFVVRSGGKLACRFNNKVSSTSRRGSCS